MEIRPMREAEREPVLVLLERAFGIRDVFSRYMDLDPAYAPEDFLLALDGERPAACVQIFNKTIRLQGEAVRLGGIGSVATDPDYRRHGLASDLLRRSEARMRERGACIGLLFTTTWQLYRGLGWVQIPVRQLALHAPAAPVQVPEGLELRAFQPGDLAALRALYEPYAARFEGTTLRDERYWQGQLRYAGDPDETFRVALRAGRPVAYARRVDLATPVAMEWAHAPGAAGDLAALLHDLAPGDRALMLRLPEGSELEPELRARAAALDVLEDPTFMWRVIDGAQLAQLAGLPGDATQAQLLAELIAKPRAHYWVSDRF